MGGPVSYRVVIARRALESLDAVLNRRLAEELAQHLSDLATDPEERGWPLAGELKGYRCLRSAGGWFRIVYRVAASTVEVVLVSVGQARPVEVRNVRALARTLFSERLLQRK